MTLRSVTVSAYSGINVAIRESRRCFSSSCLQVNEDSMKLTPMIGLEIHAQLNCATKLFSAVAVDDSAPSNSRVALFDMATPGTLPRLNQRSVEQCLRIARLLHCEVPPWCRFDRKHYFYPDMPLGYQITQKDHPIALEGFLEFYVYSDSISRDPHTWKEEFPTYSKQIKIQRIQLEMDSGKLLKLYGIKGDENSVIVTDSHNAYDNDDVELVDLNRAGVPLAEIITAPELHSAHEAICFVEQLRAFLYHNRICTGDMHKGHLRVDANVSTSVNDEISSKVEIKNLNSFRFLRNAIAFEIYRQRRVILGGGRVEEETRCLDENHIKTIPMREKGEMLDYRFTPEVNLPRLQLKTQQIESIKVDPPHLEFIEKHGFPPAYVFQNVLKNEDLERFIRQLFNDTSKSIHFETFFDILNEFKRICEQCGRHFPPKENLLLQTLREAIVFESERKLTRALCLDLLKLYISGMETHVTLQKKMESENLWRIHDEVEIGRMIEEVFAYNGRIHSKARKAVLTVNGKPTKRNKHLNKLRDEVVQRSGKRIAVEDAETHVIRRILLDK